MKKILLFITVIVAFTFSATFVHAQHLFSVNYNDLPVEKITQLTHQIRNTEISNLSLTKNSIHKEVYVVGFSSAQHTQIVILNEQTGAHVVISGVAAEFQLAPFFIEELKQGVLGNAERYVILETTNDFSVHNVASVSATTRNVHIPRYLYGPKEDIKEAFPKDRQIVHIFKEKPELILVDPNDPELQRYAAQWEEERSYYVYMYLLPDGGLWIYDEHFNIDNDQSEIKIGVGGYLEFTLSGTMNTEQRTATEYALELWSERFAGIVPVDINVSFEPMADGTLGSSTRMPNYFNSETQTWYCSAVGNQLAGYNVVPSQRDIRIRMNSNYAFHYGLNANPGSGKYDCVTIMLHEVTHGLGFSRMVDEYGRYSYTTPSGGGAYTNYPGIYERQLFQGLNGPCLTELDQAERAALVKSGNLYAGAPGSNLLAANEGVRVKIYAPANFVSGSSVSHWDDPVNNFPTFMKRSIASNSGLHAFNTRKIGILLDIGWTLPDNPNAVYVTFDGNGAANEMPTQEFLPGTPKKLRANVFNRPCYTFIEWNTSPDGTGTAYADRQTINISNNLNLYAQWQGNTYTLTFNATGGTVTPTSKQVVCGEPIGVLPTPEREGFAFNGWRISATQITEDRIWTWAQNMTATAIWTTVGIVETGHAPALQIVPNPANHTIELQIRNYELRIDCIEFYNIFGQLIKTVPFNGRRDVARNLSTQIINISDLCAGVYIVKAGGKAVKLVVK
ncbi:MAG: InlB B-repeat-containing protein [Lentimicrobiaceae bacterium]|nr:InlB B-repeat-containing protein [Lentimicrobiaceae bacterium]